MCLNIDSVFAAFLCLHFVVKCGQMCLVPSLTSYSNQTIDTSWVHLHLDKILF